MGQLVGGRGAAFVARDGPGVHQTRVPRAHPRLEERAGPLRLLAHPPRIARFVRLLDPRRGKRRRQDVAHDHVVGHTGLSQVEERGHNRLRWIAGDHVLTIVIVFTAWTTAWR